MAADGVIMIKVFGLEEKLMEHNSCRLIHSLMGKHGVMPAIYKVVRTMTNVRH